MLAPLKLMPVVPLPVTPKTSSVLAPPLRSMRSTAPLQLGRCPVPGPQGGVGVHHHDGGAAFAVWCWPTWRRGRRCWGFVLVGGDQGKGVGGGGGAADAGGQLRAAVVAIIHGHAEGDGAIDVGVGGHVADGGQCGQQVARLPVRTRLPVLLVTLRPMVVPTWMVP